MSIARAHRGARHGGGSRPRAGALTRAQLRELETELQRERARVERSIVRDGPHDAFAGRAATDGIAGPQAADARQGLAVAFESRAHARHAAIVDALDRLARGDYGRCASCGERIPHGRLLVMPETVHCISCGRGV